MSIVFLWYNVGIGGSMSKEKMLVISEKVKNNHYLYFRLLNALYKITFKNNIFSIEQIGINNIKKYSTLMELFDKYIVYGATLREQIKDIKLYDGR